MHQSHNHELRPRHSKLRHHRDSTNASLRSSANSINIRAASPADEHNVQAQNKVNIIGSGQVYRQLFDAGVSTENELSMLQTHKSIYSLYVDNRDLNVGTI